MSGSVYLCPTQHCVSLWQLAVGLLAQLGDDVAVFRPIVAEADDPLLGALVELTGAEGSFGVTAAEALHDPGALTQIVQRYFTIAERHATVLVLGSEYDCSLAPIEFALNTEVAANIDVPMVLVIASDGDAAMFRNRVAVAVAEANQNLARVLGVVTVVSSGQLAPETAAHPVPVHVIEKVPIAQGSAQLPGQLLVGGTQPVDGLPKLADMELRHLLPALRPDSLVVFSADRSDIAVGLVVTANSSSFARPVGAVATGPWPLTDGVVELWRAAAGNLPLFRCELDSQRVVSLLAMAGLAPRHISSERAVAARRAFGTEALAWIRTAGQGVGPAGVVTPAMFEHRLLGTARASDQHIVLPEGEEERILRAAARLLELQVCRLTLLGRPDVIAAKADLLGLDLSTASVIEPASSELLAGFAARYAQLRAKKGVTLEQAMQRVADGSYFGTMMVLEGLADGMVSGAVNTTAHTIRPALEVIKTKPGTSVVSSVFLMCLADRVLVFGDCAVNPNPTPEQLAEIAVSSAATARQFGIAPRVAMLSYSTGSSGAGPDVESTIEATRLLKRLAPDLPVEGPIQYDAAVDPEVAATKLPGSPVAGRATVLIFPDLQTGNNTYKAVQRSAGALAIGPVLQGLNKPINDLSRGALVSDIVNTVAITAIQAGFSS